MAKKKRHKRIVSHTKDFSGNCVEPIDYEKLANCIAKATADENDKRMNSYSVTREWMKFIICPVFWLIAVVSLVLCIGCFIYCYIELCGQDIINMFRGFISFILGLTFITISLFAFLAGKELNKETDKQFVVSVFSGMIALVALIVAFVALFMEVR